jgi:hypothetical protein
MFIQFAHSNAKNPDTETSRSLVTKAQSLQRYGFSQELLQALRDFMHQCAQAENDLSLCICLANIMTKKSDELRALEYVRSASKKLGIALPGILDIALNMMADAHNTTLDFFTEICRAHGFFPKLLRTIEVIESFDKTRKGSKLDDEFEKMCAYFPERTPNVDWENIAALFSQFFAAEEGQLPGSNLAEFLKQCLADSRLKEELAGVVEGEGTESIFSGDGLDLTKIAINWTKVVSPWREAVEPRLIVPHPDEAGLEGCRLYLATLPPDVQQGIYRLPFLLVMRNLHESQFDPARCFLPLRTECHSLCGGPRVGIITASHLALAFKFAQHPQFFDYLESSITKIAQCEMPTIQYELSDDQNKVFAVYKEEFDRLCEEQRSIINLRKEQRRINQSQEDEARNRRFEVICNRIGELKQLTVLPAQLVDLKNLTPVQKREVDRSLKGYSTFFNLVHWVRQCCGGANLDYTRSDPARVEMVTQLSNLWRTLQVHVLPVKALHSSPFGNFDNILSTISDVSNASLYVQAQSYVIAEHSGLWLKLISHYDWSGYTFFEYLLAQSIYPDNPFFDNIIKSITKNIIAADVNRFNFKSSLNEKLIEQCKHIGSQFVRVPTDAENNSVFKIEGALDLSSPNKQPTLSTVLVQPRHIMEPVAQFSSKLFPTLLEVVYDCISEDVIESFNEIARVDKQFVPVLTRALRGLDPRDIPSIDNTIRFIWNRDKAILLKCLDSLEGVVCERVVLEILYLSITDPIFQRDETYSSGCPANDFTKELVSRFILFLKTFSEKIHRHRLYFRYDEFSKQICHSLLNVVNNSNDPVSTAKNIIYNALMVFSPKCGDAHDSDMFTNNFNDLFIKGLNPKILYKVLAADGTLLNTILRSFVLATRPDDSVNLLPCEWPAHTILQVLTSPNNKLPHIYFDAFFDALNAAEFRCQELRAAGRAIVDEEYDFEQEPDYNARQTTFLAERRRIRSGDVLKQLPEEHWPILHSVVQSEQS